MSALLPDDRMKAMREYFAHAIKNQWCLDEWQNTTYFMLMELDKAQAELAEARATIERVTALIQKMQDRGQEMNLVYSGTYPSLPYDWCATELRQALIDPATAAAIAAEKALELREETAAG